MLLGGTYLHIRTSVADGTTTQDSGRFRFAESAADVRSTTYESCAADLNLMCARPVETNSIFCARAFADTPLWLLLGLASHPSESQNCTLERLAKADAPRLLFTEDEKTTKFKDHETQVILSLMADSLNFVWRAVNSYFFAQSRPGSGTSNTSLEDQDRKVQWLLANVVDFFASDGAGHGSKSKAMRRGIITGAWTRDELKELYRWSVQYKHSHKIRFSADMSEEIYYRKFLPWVSEAIEDLEALPLQSLAGIRAHAGIKQAYHIFADEYQELCLYPHYAAGSLITDNCAQAMDAAPAKLRELELEAPGEFALFTHAYAFFGNFFCFLMLIGFFSQRQRMEKRIQIDRRRLEQELNDPFLRQVLEKKAASLPEDQRAACISRLVSRAASSDAKGASLRLVRRNVRNFRFIVLFHLLLTTLVVVFLRTFPVTTYLETTMLSILVLTASYAVPLADRHDCVVVSSEQELIPATQPLLSRSV